MKVLEFQVEVLEAQLAASQLLTERLNSVMRREKQRFALRESHRLAKAEAKLWYLGKRDDKIMAELNAIRLNVVSLHNTLKVALNKPGAKPGSGSSIRTPRIRGPSTSAMNASSEVLESVLMPLSVTASSSGTLQTPSTSKAPEEAAGAPVKKAWNNWNAGKKPSTLGRSLTPTPDEPTAEAPQSETADEHLHELIAIMDNSESVPQAATASDSIEPQIHFTAPPKDPSEKEEEKGKEA